MSGSGMDYEALKKYKEQIDRLSSKDKDELFQSCSRELASRLLAKVIPRTPVGVYPKGSGKVGGTLRRGWTGGKTESGAGYANKLPVTKTGSTYFVRVENPTEYASYVEHGHRKRGDKGWVEGKHMLRISEDELNQQSGSILGRKIEKELRRRLG